MVSEHVRERYLRDPLPVRLGGLAADLARIASFSENPKNRQVVASLLEESKYFAEWIAPEAPLDVQAQLAQIQRSVALWELNWLCGRSEPSMSVQAKAWSDRLLEASGLLA